MKRTAEQKFGGKIILSILLVMGIAVQQSAAQSTLHFGLSLGPNYSNISSDVGTYNGAVSYQAAGQFEFRPANTHIAFGLEGQYISMSPNANYKDSILYNNQVTRYNWNTTLNINALHVTVLFKYMVPLGSVPISPYDRPDGSGNYLNLFVGPYVSFITNASNTGTLKGTVHYYNDTSMHDIHKDSTLTAGTTNTNNTLNGLASMTYGATVGAGVNLRIATGTELTFDFRYSRDLVSLDQPLADKYGFLGHRTIQGGILYNNANAFGSYISFNVGLVFKLASFGG